MCVCICKTNMFCIWNCNYSEFFFFHLRYMMYHHLTSYNNKYALLLSSQRKQTQLWNSVKVYLTFAYSISYDLLSTSCPLSMLHILFYGTYNRVCDCVFMFLKKKNYNFGPPSNIVHLCLYIYIYNIGKVLDRKLVFTQKTHLTI